MKLSKLIQHLPEKQRMNIYDDIDSAIQGYYLYKGRVKYFDNESFLMDKEVLAFYTLSKPNRIYIKIGRSNHENCQ